MKKNEGLIDLAKLVFVFCVVMIHARCADDNSLFISFTIVIPFLVMLLGRYKTKFDTRPLRNYSTGIYFSHRFVLALLILFVIGPITNDNPVVVFLATITVDVVVLWYLYRFKNKRINKFIT